jgi:hypothetical protein
MSFKPLDDRQVVQRSALPTSIGSSANETLDALFALIDSKMVNLAGSQNLTNKTIGISNAGLLSNTLEFEEISTPSTNPPTNVLALYPKTDGHFYTLNSSGTEVQVGSAGSAPIGSLQSAFLTLTQFQTQAGTGWVLAEGQTVPGSAYEAFGIGGGSSVTASASATVTSTGPITFSTLVLSATATTNSNNQLTNVSSVSGLAIGELISGTGIPALTTVSSISQYTFALPGTAAQYTFAVHSSTQYIFTVSAASATAGATYTNNGQTFTVNTTISGATTLNAVGTGTPLASGTLTLVTGTGDATITFSAFTYAGANATTGATYSNNTQTFVVSSTITGGTSLTAIGSGVPASSGTLILVTGTGDTTITFTSFIYGAHNATAGATYTNNGQTFTVSTSIIDGTTLVCTGTGVPLTSGTLTLASGTGDSTIPFSSVSATVTMSASAASSGSITVLFSNSPVSTNGTLTNTSNTITALNSTVGITTSQIISVTGLSPYATVTAVTVASVPDCRGLVLRGKNNGRSDGDQDPAGDLALGTYESDETAVNGLSGGNTGTESAQHIHSITNSGGSVSITGLSPAASGSGVEGVTSTGSLANNTGVENTTHTHAVTLNSSNAETRVKAIIVNHFIRIN